MRGGGGGVSNYVGRKKREKKPESATPAATPGQQQKPRKCTRYGRSPALVRQHCPATEETCHACGNKGHFKTICVALKEPCKWLSKLSQQETMKHSWACCSSLGNPISGPSHCQ